MLGADSERFRLEERDGVRILQCRRAGDVRPRIGGGQDGRIWVGVPLVDGPLVALTQGIDQTREPAADLEASGAGAQESPCKAIGPAVGEGGRLSPQGFR